MATEFARMRQMFGTTADWGSNDLVLGQGEIGFELQVSGLIVGKVGDGSNPFSLLAYTLGVGVTLDTDQTITGAKILDNDLNFLNQDTGTGLARMVLVNSGGVQLWNMASLEPNSNVAISARNIAGEYKGINILGENNQLNFGTHLIADYGGIAGLTWGSVDSAGVMTGGTRFSSVRNGVGWYSLTFDDAAWSSEQSLTANSRAVAAVSETITVSPISDVQIDVFIATTGSVAVDSAFDFTRNYATEAFTPLA